MGTLVEKLRKKKTTPYREVAKKVGISEYYVGQIARGERRPKRGKGAEALRELERIANEN